MIKMAKYNTEIRIVLVIIQTSPFLTSFSLNIILNEVWKIPRLNRIKPVIIIAATTVTVPANSRIARQLSRSILKMFGIFMICLKIEI